MKRVLEVIELEFKIRQENKGSFSSLACFGSGLVGISKESKSYSDVPAF